MTLIISHMTVVIRLATLRKAILVHMQVMLKIHVLSHVEMALIIMCTSVMMVIYLTLMAVLKSAELRMDLSVEEAVQTEQISVRSSVMITLIGTTLSVNMGLELLAMGAIFIVRLR